MPKLIIISNGKRREIEMGQELTIGRGYSNLLRLEGEEISRVHAILYKRNHDFILRDLDSKNGVYVNGSRILTAALAAGDRLQVGKYKMVFDPPSGFNFDLPAEANPEESLPANLGSESGMDISDDNLSRSQVFSGAVPDDSVATNDGYYKLNLMREEVLLFTRSELDEQLNLPGNATTEKAADYQEQFFDELLLHGIASDNGKASAFIEAVLRSIVKTLNANRGVIVLRDSESDGLVPGAVVPERGDVAVNRVVLQSGFGEGKAIICPATAECGLFRDSKTVMRDRISSLVSIPLGRKVIIGLLYIDRQGEVDGFTMAHLLVMARVGRLLELHMRDNSNRKS